jgi:multimeric flavodoxin WrbA/putative sterol carrier protein
MNVLLLRGNPRKEGFTQRLTDLFAIGARETDARLIDVDLTCVSIQPCLGCYHCWLAHPGQCVHGDAMSGLLLQVLAADVMVCATPLYYFSMSSPLKIFFERLFPLSAEGAEVSGLGLLRNRLRDPELWRKKKLISIVVGALPGSSPYEPINQTFRLIADTLDMELGGQLTRSESHLLPYRLSKPKTLKLVETAFFKAGREAGTTGRLTPKTMEEAALPLAADEMHFRTYSDIYWEHARAAGVESTNLPELHERVGSDPDILMREMARTVNPKTTARLQAVLQFDFPDRQRHYRLTVDHGRCVMQQDTTADPDLRVTCNTDVWVALFTRQIGVTDALRQRAIVLEGDKSLFAKLDRYFPPPSL